MHLPRWGEGSIDDGAGPADLDQSPGDIVVLSAVDAELAALADARGRQPDGAPRLRLASLAALKHPYSVDLYLEKTVRHARLVVLRLLGGASYWSYGLERLTALSRGGGPMLAVLPGDAREDSALLAMGTAPADAAHRLWRYLAEGGAENLDNALGYAAHLIGQGNVPAEPAPLPRFGLYAARQRVVGHPRAALVFYRSHLQSGAVAPVEALLDALDAQGLDASALYVTSLKDADCADFVARTLGDGKAEIVLNATAFAVAQTGAPHTPGPLEASGAPVLQVIASGMREEAWQASPRGLTPPDLAMHVVMPEIDGRIHARAVSFKADLGRDALTEAPRVVYQPQSDRIAYAARLAANWVRLRRKTPQERRVLLVLANAPGRDGRLANGVGLDTPASVVAICHALRAAGYDVSGAPESAAELMARLVSGPTHAAKGEGGEVWPLSGYAQALAALPPGLAQAVRSRWGAPEADGFAKGAALRLPLHRFGNLTLMVQPSRAPGDLSRAVYHDTQLVPPHGYVAAYLWAREIFQADAVVHVGKHGTLEWLPGKANALSRECWPEVLLGPVPHLYPFIVNDPGEGLQAKRRASAVILDHLTPPLARAQSHGAGAELETLLDELAAATELDAPRAERLRRDIRDHAMRHGFDRDAGLDLEDEQTALAALDEHLCELKELQIRDGLHVFGASPGSEERAALLSAIARVPRGEERARDRSLIRALAADLGLDGFDPLDCTFSQPWRGPRPEALARRGGGAWRTAGDTVERLEDLALDLIAGCEKADSAWERTNSVLAWIAAELAPAIDACGAREMAALLAGLDGRFVPPGPSGAPSRGRPDVLPTGRNFYAVDVRAVPSRAAWEVGRLSAERVLERHFEEHGEWPRALALSVWGTSNMRTGGDDIAQALAMLGVAPRWEPASGRVVGFTVLPLSELRRPRIDVTLRISGLFRDAFPQLVDLFDSAVRAIADLDEPDEANPIRAAVGVETESRVREGLPRDEARRRACFRIFGAEPGAYGTGLQRLVEDGAWADGEELTDAFLDWGSYAYGAGGGAEAARPQLEARLKRTQAVLHNQDNREHDLLDSDDYWQFEGGLALAVEHVSGSRPAVYHNDHSRPERPVTRTLSEELGRIVRARAANPKWIAGMMRHGYKGASEMAATVDYLFAFAATSGRVENHHFDQLYQAYVADETVRSFMARENAPALAEMVERFREAMRRGFWSPRSNSAAVELERLAPSAGERR
jgi:cobaltochelatase CobN